jgi:small GTP-binding protein
MIGGASVGKTSIVTRLKFETFDATEAPTIAAEFLRHEEQVRDGTMILQIWDTSGQERYRCLGPIYYRDALGAVLVFDVTRPKTFEELDTWLSTFKSVAPDGVVVVLGNKNDLEGQSEVTDSEIDAWVARQEQKMQVFRTSAATGDGIAAAFRALAEEIHCRQQDPATSVVLNSGGEPGGRRVNCC